MNYRPFPTSVAIGKILAPVLSLGYKMVMTIFPSPWRSCENRDSVQVSVVCAGHVPPAQHAAASVRLGGRDVFVLRTGEVLKFTAKIQINIGSITNFGGFRLLGFFFFQLAGGLL